MLETAPESFNAAFSIGYDINYLADQDGNFDPNCTSAFINKIATKEQFSYLSCMEGVVDTTGYLRDLVSDIALAFPGDQIIYDIDIATTAVINEPATTFHSFLYKTLDLSSGIYNYQRNIKREVFQYQAIPLDGHQILESYELNLSKEGGNLSVTLKIKAIAINLILAKLPGNATDIPLVVSC